ncbi:MAG TPA: bifunctional 4-hydroxy-2-oxoglutarate aldolase/2-dehydro-3-deoxy-phosphogluconate aldolase [Puia sp.]|nr:bifunctional 4-hydroxy-2-oxoglutarate aldolase/2-dehydro-3-deoxy-phosphogluconate aldolase [Puia sp.]
MDTLTSILKHKIVVIIRGIDPDDFLKVAGALLEGGLNIMEITLNSKNALSVLKEAVLQLGDQLLIGAGTVLNAVSAKEAISAGAKFIVSPSLDIETIRATKQLGAVSIPGAFTATEILSAYNNGADIIKVFPASIGANYLRDLHGPFPQIPMMPTGGVNLTNIREFQKAGAVAYGIGSALIDASQKMTKDYLIQVTEKAKQFAEVVKGF